MKIIEFNYKHLSFLNAWLEYHKKPRVKFEELPHIGFTAIIDKPIAVGFLHRCEGNFCVLGGLCTNPEYSSEYRSEAIDMIVDNLIQIAKVLGFKEMLALTVEETILKRSEKFGFKELSHKVIGKEL